MKIDHRTGDQFSFRGYLGRSNWPIIFACAAFIFVVHRFILKIQTSRKIQKLGGKAPIIPSRLPYDLDLIWKNVQDGKTYDELLFWDDCFKASKGRQSNTVEMKGAGRRVIITADPENIKAILATQFQDYGKGSYFNLMWREFLGDGIFSTDGQLWHNSRQLIRPQFVKDRVSDLNTFENHVQVLLSKIKDGADTDIRELFFQFTLDAATDFLLGRSVDSLNGGGAGFAHAFGEIQRLQNLISKLGPMRWTMGRKELRAHLKVLNDTIEPYIDSALRLSPEELEKRTKSDEGYTFLHALASYTRDPKILRDQIVAVLLAGRDTTACTLSWLFYELSRQPEIVSELRKEIEAVIGTNKAPTYADLKSMKTLQNCINETLRLYPVVPYNVRTSLKDTTLPHGGGPDGLSPIGIPSDTPVVYSTLYMQLVEDIPDPLTFKPSRWNSWTPKPWTYVPFNGGPRICVGQNFALTEMAYTTVRFLQRFSRLETRQIPVPTHPRIQESRAPDATNAMKMATHRELKMKSEIVLMPADQVHIAFYS